MKKYLVTVFILCSFFLINYSSMANNLTNNSQGLFIPHTYYKLRNGLKVVLSQDRTIPIVTVAVYYNIGFRIEPKNRTGFSHLFEHMMFQGSQNLGKLEFIRLVEENGGMLNGSTRFDFTNYYQTLPAHKLETILWAEADRMRSLDISQENLANQQAVVINEVKLNVLNTPYGGFPILDIVEHANTNWYNSHNFYGELQDIEAATLEDVRKFFNTYYVPNNAVLVVVGDFEVSDTQKIIDKYFGGIPSPVQPTKVDISEARQEKEKYASKKYPLAEKPAICFAYHMPERNTIEYYAMGLIDQILLQGEDSFLYQEIVKKHGFTTNLNGGINSELGNMFNYNGPMLWMTYFFYDANAKTANIVSAFSDAIARLQNTRVDQKVINRALIKLRSNLYDIVANSEGKADLLASFALFDNNPGRVNTLEEDFQKITPEIIQKTAQEYLRSSNRTILTVEAGQQSKGD